MVGFVCNILLCKNNERYLQSIFISDFDLKSIIYFTLDSSFRWNDKY